MLKQKEAFDRCDALADELEVFLANTTKRDRRDIGKILCQHIAVHAAKLDKDIFDPLKLLSESQKELQALIAEEVDADIERELIKHVKENNPK